MVLSFYRLCVCVCMCMGACMCTCMCVCFRRAETGTLKQPLQSKAEVSTEGCGSTRGNTELSLRGQPGGDAPEAYEHLDCGEWGWDEGREPERWNSES